MRPIDADALKTRINTVFFSEIGQIIDDAPTVTEWTPVSERLPSESGWYFVTVQGVERVSDMVWYYHESHEWNGVSDTQKVLAWMPLPEPYKGGDEA